MPTIVILNDFDNYFQRLVEGWCKQKKEFHHHTIQIDSGPYRADAVTTESKVGVLTLDFYSALRTGFGKLSESEIKQLIDLL